ncbi:MAG TPA: tetratricopeptide repeat protein [Anaeromyxobacteraceae bacterium]|nr:tetratricopeptide repeat protein [Anaeromyxobacteraceae bacterium]
MNRNTVIAAAAGLVVGLLVGYQLGSSGREEARPAASFGPPPGSPSPFQGGPAPMQGGPAPFPGGQPAVPQISQAEMERRIAVSQQIVARDPKNVQAWIQLGNDYFDLHRAQESIDAYAKALALQPNNPDVLTDQGVMYRALEQYDKALANFKKANQLKPDHVQSLFNIGVVYLHDLKDSAKAVQAWEKVVQVAPQSQQANDARRAIAEIKAQPGAK